MNEQRAIEWRNLSEEDFRKRLDEKLASSSDDIRKITFDYKKMTEYYDQHGKIGTIQMRTNQFEEEVLQWGELHDDNYIFTCGNNSCLLLGLQL